MVFNNIEEMKRDVEETSTLMDAIGLGDLNEDEEYHLAVINTMFKPDMNYRSILIALTKAYGSIRVVKDPNHTINEHEQKVLDFCFDIVRLCKAVVMKSRPEIWEDLRFIDLRDDSPIIGKVITGLPKEEK